MGGLTHGMIKMSGVILPHKFNTRYPLEIA